MRVVAGTAGGIRLTSPRSDLRPTMDRVKAAIFSSLADLIPDARVLDLFAGTGALGIEALSRGARSAVFVDRDAQAIAAIAENLRKTRQHGQTIRAEVIPWLSAHARGEFDLVLADPPYASGPDAPDLAAALLILPALPPLLAAGGLFVLEQSAAAATAAADPWEVVRSKTYGASRVTFYRVGTPA